MQYKILIKDSVVGGMHLNLVFNYEKHINPAFFVSIAWDLLGSLTG